MTTVAPERTAAHAYAYDEDDDLPRRRYAAQRVAAARVGGIAERMLLTRARHEGEAHRRSESAEHEPLPLA